MTAKFNFCVSAVKDGIRSIYFGKDIKAADFKWGRMVAIILQLVIFLSFKTQLLSYWCKKDFLYHCQNFYSLFFVQTHKTCVNFLSIYIYARRHRNTYIYIYCIAIVTTNWLKSQNGTLFSHVWRRGRLALDPLQNKSCSEFFSQADKNWHITWGNNLGPDWPPLARGSKFHTITHPPGSFLPSPRQWKIMSL